MKIKTIEDALEELVADKSLTLKEYGKAKIFLANQDNFPKIDTDALNEMDLQISDKKLQLEEIEADLKKKTDKMKELSNSYSNEQMVTMIDKLEKEVLDMNEKLQGYRGGEVEILSEEQISAVIRENDKYKLQWKKQKTIARELIEEISEQADMNYKQFVRDIGLEVDEDYGIDYNAMMGIKAK